MTTIIWKKSHGTAKSRHKARRAEVVAQRRKDEALYRRMATTLAGCSNTVLSAVIDVPIRTAALPSADNICLGDVAIFAAGHRSAKKPKEIKGKDAVKQWKIEREISARA